MNNGDLNTYKKLLPEVFNSIGAAIGIHVMLIVLERSLWKTKCKYHEASLIQFSEEGVILDGLDSLGPEKALHIAHEFIISTIDTLSRLIGIQLAQKLTEQLQNELETKGVD